MTLIDQVGFNAWLDSELGLDRDAKPPAFGCTHCGASPGPYRFIGEFCVICLACMYGRFTKAQEIAIWIDRNSWLWRPLDINAKAAKIEALGEEDPLPHAGETDTDFKARVETIEARRTGRQRNSGS